MSPVDTTALIVGLGLFTWAIVRRLQAEREAEFWKGEVQNWKDAHAGALTVIDQNRDRIKAERERGDLEHQRAELLQKRVDQLQRDPFDDPYWEDK